MTNLNIEQKNIERIRKLIEEIRDSNKNLLNMLECELIEAIKLLESKRVSEETDYKQQLLLD